MPTMFQKLPSFLSNPGTPATGVNAPPAGGYGYQDPLKGMGLIDRVQYFKENNPEVLMSLARGLMQGDLGSGFTAAGKAMQEGRQEEMAKQQTNVTKNQTKQWLISQGYTEAEANAAMENPTILNALIQRKSYEMQQQAQAEYDTGAGDGGGILGNPVRMKGPNPGEFRYGFPNKDTGILIDSQTGKPFPEGWTQMDDYSVYNSRAAGTGAGKLQSEAADALPQAEVDAQYTMELADQIANDPYLPEMVGYKGYLPNVSTEAQRFQSLADQLGGQAFLNAYRVLRGGGQITEAEGLKATVAILRGEVRVSEAAYKQALTDYKKYINLSLDVMRRKATYNPEQDEPGAGTGLPKPSGKVLGVRPK